MHPGLSLRVLASSSSGNCSALRVAEHRVFLIDLGLSPRRTRSLLAESGLHEGQIAGAILTHLDDDHCDPSWISALPAQAPIYLHKRHLGRAERMGLLLRRCVPFETRFDLPGGVAASSALGAHDDLGSAALRFDHAGGSLGYATDLGRVQDQVASLLEGVDVLAIESNHCPELERRSPRPDYLKRRVMGGSGHLSNEQCAAAVARIAPSTHVVLLHLSRECNRPELAASYHASAPYALTVASDREPTSWIDIPARENPAPVLRVVLGQPTLWAET